MNTLIDNKDKALGTATLVGLIAVGIYGAKHGIGNHF